VGNEWEKEVSGVVNMAGTAQRGKLAATEMSKSSVAFAVIRRRARRI
jgi:hypothetical protein